MMNLVGMKADRSIQMKGNATRRALSQSKIVDQGISRRRPPARVKSVAAATISRFLHRRDCSPAQLFPEEPLREDRHILILMFAHRSLSTLSADCSTDFKAERTSPCPVL